MKTTIKNQLKDTNNMLNHITEAKRNKKDDKISLFRLCLLILKNQQAIMQKIEAT